MNREPAHTCYLVGLISAILGGTGCSQAVTTSQCSKISSAVSGGTLSSALQYQTELNIGGYIIGYHRPTAMDESADPSTYDTSFCAATVSHDQFDPGFLGFWTATHCLDLARLVKIEFIRYRAGTNSIGTYSLDLSLAKLIDNTNRARTLLASFPDDVGNRLMSAAFRTFDDIGTEWCRNFTTTNYLADHQQLCFSSFDLSYHSFPIPALSEQSDDLKQLIAELHALPTIPDSTSKVALSNWITQHKALRDLGRLVAATRIRDQVRACGGQTVALNSTTGLCSNQAAATSLIQLIAGDLTISDSETATTALAKLTAKGAEIRTSIETFFYSNTQENRVKRSTMLGNFSFGGIGGTALAGLTIPANTGFMGLPVSFTLTNSDIARMQIHFGENGMLISRPNDLIRASYQHGDSGTLMTFRVGTGVYAPMAVLSTVNGEPTSGGLAVHPSEEGDGSGSTSGAATTTNSTSPGSVVTGEEAPTSTGEDGC